MFELFRPQIFFCHHSTYNKRLSYLIFAQSFTILVVTKNCCHRLPACFDYSANLGQVICAFTLRIGHLRACEVCLHGLDLKNLNASSENQLAHYFDNSLDTITKVFTHKQNQLLAEKNKIPTGFQTAQPKTLSASIFCL
jgi:peptidoglycan/xylan/chitin deacetylase (PgdA/CDA1 family)